MAKILLISPSFPPDTGGVEHLMRDIAEHSSHDIDVLTKPASDFDDEKFDFNVIRKSFLGYLGIIKKILYITKESPKYDKIYLAGSGESFLTIPASLLGTDIVSHAHGTELFIKIYRLRTYLRKILFLIGIRFISDFISISNWTSRRLRDLKIDEKKINQIPNGIDFSRFKDVDPLDRAKLGINSEEFVLLTVSRLHKRKGHDMVLEAIQDIDCKYVIIGKGDYKKKLEKKVEKLGINDKVIFEGYISEKELPEYYQMADLFVMPSRFMEETGNVESFGISYLEANASGLPVIGSNTGGIPTAIKNGYNGLLCEPETESVRESILKLKEDDELREEMSENAIEWAKKHDWSKIIEKIDKVLSR